MTRSRYLEHLTQQLNGKRATPEVREHYLSKIRERLGAVPTDPRILHRKINVPGPTDVPGIERPSDDELAKLPSPMKIAEPVCTCDGLGECDVCQAWAQRMLEISRGKRV